MHKLYFQSPRNMFDVIRLFDLYNPVLEKYIWLNTEKNDGNDYDSIAVHEYLSPQEAEKYALESKYDGGQYWGAYFPPGDYTYKDEDMLDYLSEYYQDPNWIIANEDYKAPKRNTADEDYKAPKRNTAAEIQQLAGSRYTIEEIRHAEEVLDLLKTKPLSEAQSILEHTKPDALTTKEWHLLLIMSKV